MGDSQAEPVDYSLRLQALMQQANISSYRALSQTAGVSRSTIAALRQGRLPRLQINALLKLSTALQVPLETLVEQFAPAQAEWQHSSKTPAAAPPGSPTPISVDALQREYERLQQRLGTQQAEIRQAVQRDAIAQIESWLLQWPTAVNAVQQNDTLPASRLLPLVKPLENLLHSWEITRIGEVGEEVTYDPQLHQPKQGLIQPGDRVQIRNVGYRQREKLLYRATVSPINT